MGLIQQTFPEPDPAKFFANLSRVEEIKLSQNAAKLVCQQAENHLIWVLGVDVGTLDSDGSYAEDFNEGWMTKTGLMEANVKEKFEQGVADKTALLRNNLSATQAIEQTPSQFNAFVVTVKSVRLADANA